MNTTTSLFPTTLIRSIIWGMGGLSLVGIVYCTGTPQPDESPPQVQAESIILFDGSSFDGWEGDLSYFRIEDKAIVAGRMEKEIPTNKFLCTEEVYEDFELALQVKFPTENNNGGIQIHSERIADHHEVIGYQIDVGYAGENPVWASIYDESRRNKFLVEAPADRIAVLLKKDGFNSYKIRAEGPRIQVWFNGEEVVDYVEEATDIPHSGIICVQIHGGPPSEAWYKDIVLTKL